jgi:hypothetical protein
MSPLWQTESKGSQSEPYESYTFGMGVCSGKPNIFVIILIGSKGALAVKIGLIPFFPFLMGDREFSRRPEKN